MWMGGGEVDMMDEGMGMEIRGLNEYLEEKGIRMRLVGREVWEELMEVEKEWVGVVVSGGEKVKGMEKGK